MLLYIAQHFEGFDPEGYSIWFCEYKYPEENTVNFIVMNKACTSPPVCSLLLKLFIGFSMP